MSSINLTILKVIRKLMICYYYSRIANAFKLVTNKNVE